MASTSCYQSVIDLKKAFPGLAPASLSASISATSSSSPSQDYDIFLNHRGPDVKFILARPLYKALRWMGVRTFLDIEELHDGDFFPRVLEDAMVSATRCVAIFSSGYAQSPWCLAELYFMLKSGKRIFPVFYRVKPSDLEGAREGKGIYANAFLDLEKKGRYSKDQIQKWKEALYEVSFIDGIFINENDDHQDVLKSIENGVSFGIRKVLEVAKHPVGLEDVVDNFETTVSVFQKTHPNVQIVGIWGIDGSGKTTLAKELFNQYHLVIERSSIIFNVKGRDLNEMQSELIQTLGLSSQKIDDQEKGKTILRNILKSAHAFIVLDDVDSTEQLDALLPGEDNLEQGSLIIVTTRDKDVLRRWGISCIYEIKKMKHSHAKELFCRHAFSKSSSRLNFEELVEEYEEFIEGFVSACDGLPLPLAELGGLLSNCFDEALWKDKLQKILQIMPDAIKNSLNVSYDALDEQEQNMFLDLACFLIGKDKRIAVAVWEGSGWNVVCGWESLASKRLVVFDSSNLIRMHGPLRDFGRQIAQKQLTHRLLCPSQITHIQRYVRIRGMMMDAGTNKVHNFPTFLINTSTGLCGFRRTGGPSVGLKILLIKGNYRNNKDIAKLSRELLWLSWTDSTLRNIPSWLSLKDLRVLEFHSSQKLVSLWKGQAEAPVELRVLIVSDCPKLQRIPKSIKYLNSLKKIVIEGSDYLRQIDILPTAVEDIQVKDCKLLRNVNCICDPVALRELTLSGMPALDVLPSFSNLASLKVLELRGLNKVERIEGLQHCILLEKLILNCKCWEVLGIESLEQLRRLRRLELVANKKAAVGPRIQTIQKWPEEVIVCTKAVADAGSHLNSLAFPNLSVHNFSNKKISHVASHFLTLLQKRSSNANAIMLCLVIQCLSPRMEMAIKLDFLDTVFSTEVEEGKWILIGVFTEHSRCFTAQDFYIQGITETHQQHAEDGEVEKGFLAIGKEHFIVEDLHRLLELLGN